MQQGQTALTPGPTHPLPRLSRLAGPVPRDLYVPEKRLQFFFAQKMVTFVASNVAF